MKDLPLPLPVEADLSRDKHDVVLPLVLPRYHADGSQEQTGEWVLVATQPKAVRAEGVPVMEQRQRVLMQRFDSVDEARACSMRYSAMRVMGGWCLNLRTGETVRVNAMR